MKRIQGVEGSGIQGKGVQVKTLNPGAQEPYLGVMK